MILGTRSITCPPLFVCHRKAFLKEIGRGVRPAKEQSDSPSCHKSCILEYYRIIFDAIAFKKILFNVGFHDLKAISFPT